ncbi:MAG: hypothetical protein GEU90_09155 [Gemmatimonas sp.]|nr:hypothetical protein [Gemmatimonas sp.]
MNEFLPAHYVESIQRLALGIECTDPLIRSRIGWPVRVTRDGSPFPIPSWKRDPDASRWEVPTVLEVLPRSDSCRHAVLLKSTTAEPIGLRIVDRSQRFVPRRLSIRLDEPIGGGRRVRPALFPGAAYPIPPGAVGVRGRILRNGEPMRWARAEARRTTDDVLVGRGFGDEHGEFVLVLEAEAGRGADLILPLTVTVIVFGPDVEADPDDFPDAAIDPLWDLPVEEAVIGPIGEEVLAGERLPAGYVSRPGSTRDVEFSWHGFVREEFDFS